MSKNRAKRGKRRSQRQPVGSGTEGPGPIYFLDADQRVQNLLVLKVQILGPFLFGQQTLCDQALQQAIQASLLPSDGAFPMFFERRDWWRVENIVRMVTATLRLCERDGEFLAGTSRQKTDEHSMAQQVLRSSDDLKDCSDEQVAAVYRVVQTQVVAYQLTMDDGKNPGEQFNHSVQEKEKLVGPVKQRGNTNFKELRYRAAIADYSRAIKLCPFSSVLYCNRALCYLRNNDNWCACLDSYRSLVLRADWEKAYYRCSEAWIKMGDPLIALEVNALGLRECSEHADLERQKKEIQALILSGKRTQPDEPTVAKEEDEVKVTMKLDSKEVSDAAVHLEAMGADRPSHKQTKVKEDPSAKNLPSTEKVKERFNQFEALEYPSLLWSISTDDLLRYCQDSPPSSSFTPSMYTSYNGLWRANEPIKTPPIELPDPFPLQEIKKAVFEEYYCPHLASSSSEDD